MASEGTGVEMGPQASAARRWSGMEGEVVLLEEEEDELEEESLDEA